MIGLIPPGVFLATGILDKNDFHMIGWDVLILMAGGIALGVAMGKSGLSDWIMISFNLGDFSLLAIMIIFALASLILSTFMSNTASTNILVPIGITVGFVISGGGADSAVSIAVLTALMASCAMSLPVSTPPNAIAYGSGLIKAGDMRKMGIIIAIFALILNFLVIQLFLV